MTSLFFSNRAGALRQHDPGVLQRGGGGPRGLRHDQTVHVSGRPQVEGRPGLEGKRDRGRSEDARRKWRREVKRNKKKTVLSWFTVVLNLERQDWVDEAALSPLMERSVSSLANFCFSHDSPHYPESLLITSTHQRWTCFPARYTRTE